MSEYAWGDLRARAVELYGQGPTGPLEQRVIDVFREHPALVAEAIEHVGRRFVKGDVHSPWIVLAKHVEEAVRPLEDVHATDERDRTKAIGRASSWMKHAGMHFESWAEVEDELFGERGLLRLWRSDETLRQRMAKLWREVRSEGELVEEQGEERARRYRERPQLTAQELRDLALARDDEPKLDEPESTLA